MREVWIAVQPRCERAALWSIVVVSPGQGLTAVRCGYRLVGVGVLSDNAPQCT